jgi:hypothetical protein
MNAIGTAIVTRLDAMAKAGAGANGSKDTGDGKYLTAPQFQALRNLMESQSAALKALPETLKQTVTSKGGNSSQPNPDLDAFLEEWRFTKYQKKNGGAWDTVKKWSFIIAAIVGIIAITSLITYLVTWRDIQSEANKRVERMIAAQPYDARVPAFLASHHGILFKGPLTQNEGHNETTGIIIKPGDLKLSQSWVSTDGSTVIPIQ